MVRGRDDHRPEVLPDRGRPVTPPVVVGLDLSLTATGAAWEQYVHLIPSTPDDGTLDGRHRRLSTIRLHVQRLLLGLGPWDIPRVDLVVVEGPSHGHTSGKHHDRSGLWWLVVDDIRRLHLPTVEVTPAQLKTFATGKGNATKADLRMSLYQRAGIDERDDNLVDAYWLSELGRHLHGTPLHDLPKTHTRALDKITLPIGL